MVAADVISGTGAEPITPGENVGFLEDQGPELRVLRGIRALGLRIWGLGFRILGFRVEGFWV